MPGTEGSFILQMFAERLLHARGSRREQTDRVIVLLGLACLSARKQTHGRQRQGELRAVGPALSGWSRWRQSQAGGAEGTLLGRASAEGTFSHSAGEGGTRAKGLEEFFMEEGRAGQRSRGGTHVGVLRTGAGAVGVPRNMWPV